MREAPIVANRNGTLGVTDGKVDVRGTANTTQGALSVANAAAAKEAYELVAKNHKAKEYGTLNPRYTLNVYGPRGEEVAGFVNGLPDRIGGVASKAGCGAQSAFFTPVFQPASVSDGLFRQAV